MGVEVVGGNVGEGVVGGDAVEHWWLAVLCGEAEEMGLKSALESAMDRGRGHGVRDMEFILSKIRYTICL